MVYDLTQINDELDMLEIRLNILDPYVDFFVVGQSTQTFSGNDKVLHFNKHEERWSKWRDKIIDVIMPRVETDDVFERTAIQKDSLRTALADCSDYDVIVYGDVDEIWKAQSIVLKEGKLRQQNYCYYLNQRSSEDWQGTNVCFYKNLGNLNDLRANHSNVIEDGGWHFTNMGGIDQIRSKIASYDHQEMINDDVRARLEERMENGEDYLGRRWDWQGRPFEMYLDEQSLPTYLKENKEKWIHLFK